MKKTSAAVWLGLGAACVACCAPLLIPLVGMAGAASAGTFASGYLLGLPLNIVVGAALLAAMAAGTGIWLMLRRAKTAAVGFQCTTACNDASSGS